MHSESCVRFFLLTAAIISTAAAFCIFLVLVYLVSPLFTLDGLGKVLSWHWRPYEGQFGILPMMVGSLMLSLGALALACPLAVGVCSLTLILGDSLPSRAILALIHYMTSIPTVIYGFVSVFMLVPLIRQWFDKGTGFSLLAAMLTLSVLITPTIVLVYRARLEQIQSGVFITSEALGIPRVSYVRKILIPLAKKGLVTAVILGFGRAIGDTLVSLMLAGNAPIVPNSVLDSFRSLTAHIGLVVATDSQSTFYHSVFAAGLILFLIMTGVNLIIRRLGGGST
jgi:phosphate transport system permease protein